MDAILKTIGTIILAGTMIALPILLPISFIYNWGVVVQLLLIMATLLVFYFTVAAIQYYVKE